MSNDTRQQILHKAEDLVRSRGYTGFSYADLAAFMGMTKASVHYHFPTKEDLLIAMLENCIGAGSKDLVAMRLRAPDPVAALRAYAKQYLDRVEQATLPICGALAGQRSALPPRAHPLVAEFFQIQLDWLTEVIEDGCRQGLLTPPMPSPQAATVLFSAIEGGTMLGWGIDRAALVLTGFEAVMDCMTQPAATTSARKTSVAQTPVAVGKRQQGQTGPRKRTPSRRSAAQAGGPLK